MKRIAALLSMLLILAIACAAIWVIAIWPATQVLYIQALFALVVASLLLFRDGLRRGGRTLFGLGKQVALFGLVTIALVRWGGWPESTYIYPPIFFSSVLSFQLIVAMISLRQIMLALRPGRGRSVAAVLRGILSSGMSDVRRLRFHVDLNARTLPWGWKRPPQQILAGAMAIMIWTLGQVPKRVEIYENRISMLGG